MTISKTMKPKRVKDRTHSHQNFCVYRASASQQCHCKVSSSQGAGKHRDAADGRTPGRVPAREGGAPLSAELPAYESGTN